MVTLSFAETFVSPSLCGGPEAEGIVKGTVFGAGVTGTQLTTRISIKEKMIKKAGDFV